MMYNTYKISELCDIKIGRTPPRNEKQWFNQSENDYKWISIKDLGQANKFIDFSSETVTEEAQKRFNIPIVESGTVILSFKLTLGKVAICAEDMLTNEAIAQFPITRTDLLDRDYLYYYLRNFNYSVLGNTSSIATAINSKIIKNMEIVLPPLDIQKKIAAVLSSIDDKINNNANINNNLLQQVMALFQRMFVETENDSRRKCRADEYFDISIGKTPPRKEPQWFSTNPEDRAWVSISDMGSCGLYIANSSEYLTHEAVGKFNVKIVPDNTVLLSFKLTVGRVAITDGDMTTNEAIAHFITNTPAINEYLYCYLKGFNYQTMGSTSSIATAVNSKIIKAMPFVVPTDEELHEFHSFAAPMFDMIKSHQRENARLTEIRNLLQPRLMTGEIDLSDIEI